MIAYLFFFMVAGIPALFYWRKTFKAGWILAWVVFVLFIGLRHQVGGDWPGYLLITQHISEISFAEAIRAQEPLFGALTWVSAQMGFGVYGVNLIGAAIFCTGLFSYCATFPNRWLALAAATPFLVIVAVMSANRQGIAIGIVLFVMAHWGRWNLQKRSAGFVLAGMFHSSALLLLSMSVLDLRISRIKKLFLLALVTALGLWLIARSEGAFYRYTRIYIAQPKGVYSPGAIFHLLLNLGPAILMLTIARRKFRRLPSWPLLRQLCWMAFGLLAMVPFYSVAAGRMSLYLFPISITFLSSVPDMFRGAPSRALARIVCVLALGVVLALWFAFANTAFTYLPYRNVLTIPTSSLVLP